MEEEGKPAVFRKGQSLNAPDTGLKHLKKKKNEQNNFKTSIPHWIYSVLSYLGAQSASVILCKWVWSG